MECDAENGIDTRTTPLLMVHAVLLGTAQDGGRPQPGCIRPCCRDLGPHDVRHPVALGLIDDSGQGHLVEATRAMGDQLRRWGHPPLASIALTHAHFGHVDGLGLLGKETMAMRDLPLYASPSMIDLLHATPMWSVLVQDGVIKPHAFTSPVVLGPGLSMEAIPVPHRAELSDMHALLFRGPNRSLLFLPDHDTWEETLAQHDAESIRSWFRSLQVDVALIDGTFWSGDELPSRSQHEVPHPPVMDTLDRMGDRRDEDAELVFIHLNHTNPLHVVQSAPYQTVLDHGWAVGEQGMNFKL